MQVNGWWEWPLATITREIAVENRSHNLKTADTKLQSFFSIISAVFLAGGWAESCLPCEARRAKKGTCEPIRKIRKYGRQYPKSNGRTALLRHPDIYESAL
ncbi:MAG: hypothetical protein GY850_45000 [bacterium]|nr:hypothetical protein [bacterium]